MKLLNLESSFDNEKAEELLNLSVGLITHTSELIRKSIYDFDLETPEGIEKLMALIPIMDPEILKDIMTSIWPGYPTDVDARRHRLEIKGYLKDYLETYEADQELPLTGSESVDSNGEEDSTGEEDPAIPKLAAGPADAKEASVAGEDDQTKVAPSTPA